MRTNGECDKAFGFKSPIIRLRFSFASGFKGYWGNLRGKLVGSILILIGSVPTFFGVSKIFNP